jgi:gamma-glutamyl-gamma-aminobutyrate hydrolase PuuD
MVKRLGITMRVAKTPYEERDCLAHDWGAFFTQYLPDWDWMPIPNVGADAGDLWQRWQLDAVVLSGGNDIGSVLQRDETERSLLDAATTLQRPVLGVCRGHQFLQHFAGDALVEATTSTHVNHDHPITWQQPMGDVPVGHRAAVNSFHNLGVPQDALAPTLQAVACSDDGLVEILQHQNLPWLGVQWHPERPGISADLNQALLTYWLQTMASSRP